MRSHVHETTVLDAPWRTTTRRFGADPHGWLPPPARPTTEGTIVAMRAMGVGVDALVEVGGATEPGGGLMVRTIAWRAHRVDSLFPRMVGELELSRTGTGVGGGCRLTLVGAYQPPVSVIGDAADRLIGRHVAIAVVRDLLDDVAHRLVGTA